MEPFKIDFEGRNFVFDMGRVNASEWRAVRVHCGHNPFELFDALSRGEIESIESLFWLVCRQNGEPPFDFGQRQFGLLGFLEGWNAATEAQTKTVDADVPKAVPTPPLEPVASPSD